MNKELAKKLLFLVNDQSFSELIEYIDSRISYHKDQLALANDMEKVRTHQGSIQELLRLKQLRTSVLNALGKLDEKGNPKIN